MLLRFKPSPSMKRVTQAMSFEVEADMSRAWVESHLFRAMFDKGLHYLKSCGLAWTGEPVRLEGPLPALPVAMDGTVTAGDVNHPTGMVRYRMITAFLVPVVEQRESA